MSHDAPQPGTPVPQSPAAVSVEMLSDPMYLSGAREMVSSVARRLGFSDEGCGQIALAVDEALCNIIRHGYDRRKDGKIWIRLWPLAGAESGKSGEPGMMIILDDEAKQVDPEKIRSRDLDEIRPGGLGVHIIRQVMDEVSYQKRGAVGMRLVLVKRRGAGRGAEPERAGEGVT